MASTYEKIHENVEIFDPEFVLELWEAMEEFDEAGCLQLVGNSNGIGNASRFVLLRHNRLKANQITNLHFLLNTSLDGLILEGAAATTNQKYEFSVICTLEQIFMKVIGFCWHLVLTLNGHENVVRNAWKNVILSYWLNEWFSFLGITISITQCGVCNSNAATLLSTLSLSVWYYWLSSWPVFKYLFKMSTLGVFVLLVNSKMLKAAFLVWIYIEI